MGTVKQKLEWPFLGVGNLNEQTSSCVIPCYSGKIGTGAFPPVKLPLSKVWCRDVHQYKVPHAGSGSAHSRPKQDEELCSRACSFPLGAGALPSCCLAWAPARGWCVQGSRMLRLWPLEWFPEQNASASPAGPSHGSRGVSASCSHWCPVKNTWIVVPKQNTKRRECLRLGQMPDTRSFRHMGWRLKLQVIENRGS